MHFCFLPRSLALVALCLSPVCLAAQTTAYTEPMGGSVLTIAKNVTGGVFVSCPYIHENEFSGTLESITEATDSSELFFAGTPFTSGTFDEVAPFPRYYLEITESGHIHEGYAFDIISNTSNSVVLPAKLATDYSLAAGDAVQIRKHMTLDDFFANAESSLTLYLDTVKFFNSDGTTDLYTWFSGPMWLSNSESYVGDAGPRPIYPGEGFLATFSNEITFVVSGKVKTSKTVVPIPENNLILSFVGSASPVEETLESLDLAQSGLTDYFGTAKFFTDDGTLTTTGFYTDLGTIMGSGTLPDASGVTVAPGSALLISNSGIEARISLPAAYDPPQ